MKNVTTTPELSHSTTESNSHLFDDWFDPIESGIRDRVRGLIGAMIRGELARPLADEPIVRLVLDGTVVRVRLDRKATSISLLVVLGVRQDGQKALLAIKQMGGESTEAWRTVLDDLVKRGLRRPELLIVDGAP